MGVATDNARHDGGVHHAQALNTVHLQACIDHVQGAATHAATAHGVVNGVTVMAYELRYLLVALGSR